MGENKLGWECHTQDLSFKIQNNTSNIAKTPQSGVYSTRKLHMVGGGWVGGRFFQDILPLLGSILQAGTCQILSIAKNPRWS